LAYSSQTPQVSPDFKVIYPFYPHEVPQEFLIIQFPLASYPVAKTPWFKLVLQLEKTPDLYNDQLVASTATEVGYELIFVTNLLQLFKVYDLEFV